MANLSRDSRNNKSVTIAKESRSDGSVPKLKTQSLPGNKMDQTIKGFGYVIGTFGLERPEGDAGRFADTAGSALSKNKQA